jgi:hypothetical protein
MVVMTTYQHCLGSGMCFQPAVLWAFTGQVPVSQGSRCFRGLSRGQGIMWLHGRETHYLYGSILVCKMGHCQKLGGFSILKLLCHSDTKIITHVIPYVLAYSGNGLTPHCLLPRCDYSWLLSCTVQLMKNYLC